MPVPQIQQYMAPINPLQGFMQGAQIGQQVGGVVQGIQDRQAAANAAAAVNAATVRIFKKTASPEDYALAQQVFPADKIKAMNESLAAQTTEQRIASAQESGAIVAAVTSKNYDVAKALLKKRADALAANGDTQGAAMFTDMANRLGTDAGDASVNTALGIGLSMTDEGQKALKAMGTDAQLNTIMALKDEELKKAKTEGEKAAIELKYADSTALLANLKTSAEIDKMNAETDKFKAELEASRNPSLSLDANATSLINKSVESALSSDLLATQAANLAASITKAKPPSGWPKLVGEAWKKLWGGQDNLTSLQQEYTKLRNTDVLKNLPPGVASDKDIEIAMAAFPPSDSNPDQIASFLNGMAKLQSYSSAVNKAKSQWVNQNGSLAPAKGAFRAGGVQANKGQDFWDFIKSIPVPNVSGANGPGTTEQTGNK